MGFLSIMYYLNFVKEKKNIVDPKDNLKFIFRYWAYGCCVDFVILFALVQLKG